MNVLFFIISFCLYLDDIVNWYFSSEEEEGSSVKLILKIL